MRFKKIKLKKHNVTIDITTVIANIFIVIKRITTKAEQEEFIMALKNLFGRKKAENGTACGTACGAGDKKPAACGTACGAGDK